VVERISAEVEPLDSFAGYLKTKHEKMGHIQDSNPDSIPDPAPDSLVTEVQAK
jgi:hypothetical protein